MYTRALVDNIAEHAHDMTAFERNTLVDNLQREDKLYKSDVETLSSRQHLILNVDDEQAIHARQYYKRQLRLLHSRR